MLLSIVEFAWGLLVPLLMAGTALWLFFALLGRVKRQSLTRLKAALFFFLTILFPVIYLGILFLLSGFANSFESPRSIWNGDAALGVVYIVAILMLFIAVLNVVLWLTLVVQARKVTKA